MAEASHVEEFNCTPEEFFNILKDYEKYPQFLKEVKSCRILEDRGNEKIVEYKVSVIKDVMYLNKQLEMPPNEIRWKFMKGEVFKSMEGSWKLEATADNRTRATYWVSAEFGLFVPSMITKTLLSVNLPAMMQAHHRRVKELYGK
jgi:coenzyme Q-binding protein COQ10